MMDKNKEISQTDHISTEVLNRMGLTLDCDLTFDRGDIVPKLGHWLFFLPHVKASEEGTDGHPKTGGFIPSIEGLDRRMWAGSRFWLHHELYASKYAPKKSRIVSMTEKEGRSKGCQESDYVSIWTVNDSGLETVFAQARII